MPISYPIPSCLGETIAAVRPVLPQAEARRRLDSLTKPVGALGRLEDFAAQLTSLRIGSLRKAVYVFAADHGLAGEGVSAYPAEVTRQMVLNFLAGGAAVNVLARLHGASLHVVNCGVAGDLPPHLGVPVRAGSRNMLHEPAMSEAEFEAALTLGLQCAAALDANLVAVGEMGIGNTSAASLITTALTGHALAATTGRGTGLDDAGHARKMSILTEVLALHRPACTTPAELLRRLGGLELAAMTGFILGAAAGGAAIVIDGFISTAAAACALALAPQVKPYLFAGHASQEPGHRLLLAHVGLQPILSLDMRLGEGTGAVLAMPVLESALALFHQMATFNSAGVSEASR